MRFTTVWTLQAQTQFAAITGQSRAAFPPKHEPRVIPNAPHVLWIGVQRQSGKTRWRRSCWSRPAEVLENWRDLAAKHQIPHEDRYLQGYEDDSDVLVHSLKKSDKNDKDQPHLCRATWRRKRARRRLVDRQKKIECCEEGRAPLGKPKSKHLNWERMFGNVEVPKALSEFYSAIFEFPNTVQGQTLRKAEHSCSPM